MVLPLELTSELIEHYRKSRNRHTQIISVDDQLTKNKVSMITGHYLLAGKTGHPHANK